MNSDKDFLGGQHLHSFVGKRKKFLFIFVVFCIFFTGIAIHGFAQDENNLSFFKNKEEEYYKSMTVYLEQEKEENLSQIFSLTASYQSDNDEYPAIQFFLVNDEGSAIYYSPHYRIGERDLTVTKQWRIPPFQKTFNKVKIDIIIPKGVKLTVNEVARQVERNINKGKDTILFHAHEGFKGLCAPSTVYSFQMAGRMGYKSCITIPKFTVDGVGICYHDDGTVRKKLRYLDGSIIPEGSKDDRRITEFTYDELMKFDAGVKRSSAYAGEKVPTLDQFFAVCAQYGMSPVLSVHSSSDFWGQKGIDHFTYIRKMAEKNGVLRQLRVKSGNYKIQKAALRVFGHDIAGYILIQGQKSTWDPLEVAKMAGLVSNGKNSIKDSNYNVVMEYFYAAATDAKIQHAMKQGFPVSIATTGPGISGPELERLITMGVTEFTVDHHCSMGLNW